MTFDGLTIEGHHTGGWTNAQMAAIHATYQATGFTVINCIFRNMVGWPVRQDGGYQTTVQYNQFINCGNGLNVNTDGSVDHPTVLSDNSFTDSEGIESAGAYTFIERNTFSNALAVAIALGGDTSGRLLPGIKARNNIVNGVSAGSAVGILVTHGCDGALVENNEVDDAATGIAVTKPGGYPTVIKDTLIQNNTIRRASNVAIYLPVEDGISGTVSQGNVIE